MDISLLMGANRVAHLVPYGAYMYAPTPALPAHTFIPLIFLFCLFACVRVSLLYRVHPRDTQQNTSFVPHTCIPGWCSIKYSCFPAHIYPRYCIYPLFLLWITFNKSKECNSNISKEHSSNKV